MTSADRDPESVVHGQYFDADPDATSKPRQIELVLPDVYLQMTTDRGVFSGAHVDDGTRFLLREHPPIDERVTSILDIGCGYGPIGLTAAARASHANVWGIDVNNRAIELARSNAALNRLPNAHFGQAHDVPDDLVFDLILSNPPIRIGKAALHELLTTWLARLTPSGRAWLVVQKHLGSDSLARWLTTEGFTTTRLQARKGFRLLETRPRVAP